jgi:hypothetical protein
MHNKLDFGDKCAVASYSYVVPHRPPGRQYLALTDWQARKESSAGGSTIQSNVQLESEREYGIDRVRGRLHVNNSACNFVFDLHTKCLGFQCYI